MGLGKLERGTVPIQSTPNADMDHVIISVHMPGVYDRREKLMM